MSRISFTCWHGMRNLRSCLALFLNLRKQQMIVKQIESPTAGGTNRGEDVYGRAKLQLQRALSPMRDDTESESNGSTRIALHHRHWNVTFSICNSSHGAREAIATPCPRSEVPRRLQRAQKTTRTYLCYISEYPVVSGR
jgi:hypothetical protein